MQLPAKMCPSCGAEFTVRATHCNDCEVELTAWEPRNEQRLSLVERVFAPNAEGQASANEGEWQDEPEADFNACPACEARLAPQATSCDQCGLWLSEEAAPDPPEVPASVRERFSNLLVLLLMLALAAIAIYWVV